MTCLVCGSENKPENRFCGLCGGVLVGRRQGEDDAGQSPATACASCGNTNDPIYNFCGTCGVKIERRKLAEGGSADATAHESLPTADLAASSPRGALPKLTEKPLMALGTMASGAVRARSIDRNPDGPAHAMPNPKRKAIPTTISGPSFLGLSSDSENGEYLLEEDEGGSSGSGLRVLLVVLLFAGIAGAILLQVRSKHTATPQPPELATSASAGLPGPQAESRLPSTPGGPQNGTSSTGPVNNADVEHHPLQPEAREDENKAASAPNSPLDMSAKDLEPKDNQTVGSEVIKKPTSKRAGAKEKLPEEPRYPSIALVNAQRYLQGRGVRQDCEQGLLYLKAATKQNDPQAAVQMAALYASGHCVPQDRVQAYRWFTSASSLQPSNRWIEKNLNWLWADMTSVERQQISK